MSQTTRCEKCKKLSWVWENECQWRSSPESACSVATGCPTNADQEIAEQLEEMFRDWPSNDQEIDRYLVDNDFAVSRVQPTKEALVQAEQIMVIAFKCHACETENHFQEWYGFGTPIECCKCGVLNRIKCIQYLNHASLEPSIKPEEGTSAGFVG